MLHKAMMVAAAMAAVAVAAATGVVALAFALYALLRPLLGPAGAAAGVAALCAVAITVAGLVAARGAKSKESHSSQDRESHGLMERLMELVRDKPMASAGVALAAGLMVMRNPAVIGVVLRTLMEAWAISNAGGKPKGR